MPANHYRAATMTGHLTARVLVMALMAWASAAQAASETDAVERTIRAAAQAAATFSETRDRQTVLDLYAEDYEGIQDGQSEDKAAIGKWLTEYEMELQRGSGLRFIGAVSNLRTSLSGSWAWATYDYLFQAVRSGELEGHDAGKCTSLLRKEAARWVIFHEHCSKPRSGRTER
jgi:ketosteroid isomerase-like protein